MGRGKAEQNIELALVSAADSGKCALIERRKSSLSIEVLHYSSCSESTEISHGKLKQGIGVGLLNVIITFTNSTPILCYI